MTTGTEHEIKTSYWLALDTATANMSIVIMRGSEVVAANESMVERNHSVRLLPEIQDLLARAGIRMKEIRAIAVGCGPGSYTGVRIGITVAKTLAWSLRLPLISVSSLGALAFGYVSGGGGSSGEKVWLVPMLDGRRRQVFTGLYEWREGPVDEQSSVGVDGSEEGDGAGSAVFYSEPGLSGIWRNLESDRIILFADWLEHIQNRVRRESAGDKPQRIILLGETESFQEEAEEWAAQLDVPVIVQQQVIHGQDIAWLAWDRLVNQQADEIHSLVPNYTQLAEAEQKLLSRKR